MWLWVLVDSDSGVHAQEGIQVVSPMPMVYVQAISV